MIGIHILHTLTQSTNLSQMHPGEKVVYWMFLKFVTISQFNTTHVHVAKCIGTAAILSVSDKTRCWINECQINQVSDKPGVG